MVPVGAADFPAAMRMASETYHALGKLLHSKGYQATVGDEGGYAPSVKGGSREALELIMEADCPGRLPGRQRHQLGARCRRQRAGRQRRLRFCPRRPNLHYRPTHR